MCIKIKISGKVHLLQELETQNTDLIQFDIFYTFCTFPIMPSKSCCTILWVKNRSPVVILFSKNKTLDAFLSKQIFSVSYTDTFTYAWHMLRQDTWWQGSLALSIRNRRNWVLIYQQMYLSVYAPLSCNNSVMTETQVSLDTSLPSADVKIFIPFFFPPHLLFLASEYNHICKLIQISTFNRLKSVLPMPKHITEDQILCIIHFY